MGKYGKPSKSHYVKKEKKVILVKEHDRNEQLFNELIRPKMGYVRSLVEYYSSWCSDIDYNYSVVLERFFRYIGTYDRKQPLDTWIHICVKNGVFRLNHEFAKEKDRRTGVEFEQVARSAGQTSDITEGQRSLAESLPDEVYSALLSIPAHKLSPFLLYVQGYSLKEIAQMEYENGNTPEYMLETVKSRIFWTRSRLKTLLKEYAGSRKLQ